MDGQAVMEASLLYFQIVLQKLQFLLQRDLLRANAIEGHSQQDRKLERHSLCRGRVSPGQRGNGVQRVEQKMRLHLASQYLELCLRQTGFKPRRLHLSFAISRVVRNRVGQSHSGDTSWKILQAQVQEPDAKRSGQISPTKQHAPANEEPGNNRGNRKACRCVDDQRFLPSAAAETIAGCDRKNGWGNQHPEKIGRASCRERV